MRLTVHLSCITLFPESQLEVDLLKKWENQKAVLQPGTMHCSPHGYQFTTESIREVTVAFVDEKVVDPTAGRTITIPTGIAAIDQAQPAPVDSGFDVQSPS